MKKHRGGEFPTARASTPFLLPFYRKSPWEFLILCHRYGLHHLHRHLLSPPRGRLHRPHPSPPPTPHVWFPHSAQAHHTDMRNRPSLDLRMSMPGCRGGGGGVGGGGWRVPLTVPEFTYFFFFIFFLGFTTCKRKVTG